MKNGKWKNEKRETENVKISCLCFALRKAKENLLKKNFITEIV
jgi:hypothetical protein